MLLAVAVQEHVGNAGAAEMWRSAAVDVMQIGSMHATEMVGWDTAP
jgi:hypothetical protein